MRGTFVPRTEGFEPVSRLGVREGGCLADTRLVSFQSTVRHALVKRVAEQGLVGACLPQTASVHDCPAWNCLRLAEQSRERGVARTQLMRDPPKLALGLYIPYHLTLLSLLLSCCSLYSCRLWHLYTIHASIRTPFISSQSCVAVGSKVT